MKTWHLLLVASFAFALVACSSAGAPPAVQAPSVPAASQFADSTATLSAIELDASGAPRLVLKTSPNPAYTSYSPQPDVFVVDLPKTGKASSVMIPADLPEGILSVAADEAVELGTPMTRVTIRFASPVVASAAAGDSDVTVNFDGTVRWADSTPELPVVVAETIAPSSTHETASETVSSPATALTAVQTRGSGAGLEILLEGDGRLSFTTFRLTNPLRLVVDVVGVRNQVAQKSFELGDPYVKRLRVAQYQIKPVMITRVVFDLDESVEHSVQSRGSALLLTFGGSSPAVYNNDVQVADSRPAVAAPVIVAAVEQPKPAVVPPPAPEPVVVHTSAPPAMDDLFAPPPSIPVKPAIVEPKLQERVVISSPAPQQAPAPSEDVFVPNPTRTMQSPTMTNRTLSGEDRVYSGEPIDLTLKDADIKDVLRTFAQLTGLNIAIDPQVSGTVTVEFIAVPWDQALELILRQNGLWFDLEGNVMRIGTTERLATERKQARALDEERRLNVQLQTVIRDLSYARAGDVQSLLTAMASPRGKIIVDQRTNQLIITEVPEYLQTMLNLIAEVDVPTPQVVIEARIVETSKNFTRQLGIEWGFQGALDPALGTGTGLVFPNRVGFTGGPFNFGSGNPVLSMSLGNVLGTFDLDFTLTAAETEGLVRIVSAPRVTTQDNHPAEIQSGVQIPIQTRVNFTTTVQYIDATLRLSVTPQITAEGTVIMDIQVQKTEPALGLSVIGGDNAPLITRRAQTRLMVRDGGTTVIGGIYQSTDNDAQTRLPFLHRVPVLGNLFKNVDISRRHDELLIFITPRIVRNT